MSSTFSVSSDSDSNVDVPDELGLLAEEFLESTRRGTPADIESYCATYPHLADRIRAVFPTLLAVEQCVAPSTSQAQAIEDVTSSPIPSRIGDFQIIREIGRGGMGIVYEAVQQSLGRRVALKVLPVGASISSHNLQRFRRESRAAAKLHHSNIVPVFGVGEHEGMNYYVMQFIQGVGLDQVLAQLQHNDRSTILHSEPAHESLTQSTDSDSATATVMLNGSDSSSSSDSNASSDRIYWQRVALIAMQLARALEFAHSQGVLHRDLKPANVLLDIHGTVWLTDFGLARINDDAELTRTGDIVGTLRYLAPERLRGECSPQSDVYGLGVTLYELLTFVPAFNETDRHALIKQIVQHAPKKPRSINRKIPRDLETIVLKAIEKEIPNRYARAADLADDLERFLSDRPIHARRVAITEQAWRWCRRNPTVALLGSVIWVLLLGLAFVWTTLSWVSRDRERVRAEEEKARAAQSVARQEETLAQVQSHLAKARSFRYSEAPTRKSKSLAEVQAAMQLSPPPELRFDLRNEAISAMAQTDVRFGKSVDIGGRMYDGASVDRQLNRIANFEGDCVVVRRLSDGQQIARLSMDTRFAACLVFSGDGRFLIGATSGEGGEFEVWDVDEQRTVLSDMPPFRTLGFSNDSTKLTVSHTGTMFASIACRTER